MTADDVHPDRSWLVILGGVVLVFLVYLLQGIDRSKVPARESSAIGRLRNIIYAQKEFRATHNCFASDLGQLRDVTSGDHDYAYSVQAGAKDEKGCVTEFVVTASPVSSASKGCHFLWMDEKETLRFGTSHPATSASPILQ